MEVPTRAFGPHSAGRKDEALRLQALSVLSDPKRASQVRKIILSGVNLREDASPPVAAVDLDLRQEFTCERMRVAATLLRNATGLEELE